MNCSRCGKWNPGAYTQEPDGGIVCHDCEPLDDLGFEEITCCMEALGKPKGDCSTCGAAIALAALEGGAE